MDLESLLRISSFEAPRAHYIITSRGKHSTSPQFLSQLRPQMKKTVKSILATLERTANRRHMLTAADEMTLIKALFVIKNVWEFELKRTKKYSQEVQKISPYLTEGGKSMAHAFIVLSRMRDSPRAYPLNISHGKADITTSLLLGNSVSALLKICAMF